jgi:hypothetical protein
MEINNNDNNMMFAPRILCGFYKKNLSLINERDKIHMLYGAAFSTSESSSIFFAPWSTFGSFFDGSSKSPTSSVRNEMIQ